MRVDTNLSALFKFSVRVRQGCVLSPILFNALLEELVSRATDQFDGGISILGKQPANLRLADDISLLSASASNFKDLTMRLDETSKKMGMEIGAEISKLLVVDATIEKIDEIVEVCGAHLKERLDEEIGAGATIQLQLMHYP